MDHARVAGGTSDATGVVQALAGVAPTVIESRSKDWVPLLLGFCAPKGSGGAAASRPSDAVSDDEDGADDEDAAMAGAASAHMEWPCQMLFSRQSRTNDSDGVSGPNRPAITLMPILALSEPGREVPFCQWCNGGALTCHDDDALCHDDDALSICRAAGVWQWSKHVPARCRRPSGRQGVTLHF